MCHIFYINICIFLSITHLKLDIKLVLNVFPIIFEKKIVIIIKTNSLLVLKWKTKYSDWVNFTISLEKASMMRASQNFLLYNGTIIKIKVNEFKKKYFTSTPPPLGIHTTCTHYNDLISKRANYFNTIKVFNISTIFSVTTLLP